MIGSIEIKSLASRVAGQWRVIDSILESTGWMTEIIEAIILGVVQGLTEFLPVSSSGHLEIARFILNDDGLAKQNLLMTVVLHFATALSTVVVFRREIGEILAGLLQFANNEQFQFCVRILISMIPAVIVGLLFDEQIEALFSKQMLLVGLMLIVTGVLLLFADRARNTTRPVGYASALIIGISQAIAILPGISRSGATISTSVLLGIDREQAARFSFLMVVPLIFGKMAKDVLDDLTGLESNFSAVDFLPLLAGFMAAFLTGMLACTWMIRLVKASRLSWFSVYCFAVAAFAIGKGLGLI